MVEPLGLYYKTVTQITGFTGMVGRVGWVDTVTDAGRQMRVRARQTQHG